MKKLETCKNKNEKKKMRRGGVLNNSNLILFEQVKNLYDKYVKLYIETKDKDEETIIERFNEELIELFSDFSLHDDDITNYYNSITLIDDDYFKILEVREEDQYKNDKRSNFLQLFKNFIELKKEE